MFKLVACCPASLFFPEQRASHSIYTISYTQLSYYCNGKKNLYICCILMHNIIVIIMYCTHNYYYSAILYLPYTRKIRVRDISKFHTQLSIALLGMLLVFVTGIDRTEQLGSCVFVSVLIHYFTLAAVMWMGAEAVLMFQKLVIVFVQITTRYIVIVSLICWCKSRAWLDVRLWCVMC